VFVNGERGGEAAAAARAPDRPAPGVPAQGLRPSLELYFGSTTGEVFGSGDAGATWFDITTRLPPVYAVSAI
jgi:hypothetical protein